MINIEEIQPGWTVVDAHGEEVGKVIEVNAGTLRVKKGGLLGGEIQVPRDSITEVETGRVELNRSKGDL